MKAKKLKMFSQFKKVTILKNGPCNINLTWISKVDWSSVGSFHETDKSINLSQSNIITSQNQPELHTHKQDHADILTMSNTCVLVASKETLAWNKEPSKKQNKDLHKKK